MSYTDDDGVTTSKTSTAVTVGDAPPTVTVTGTATEGQTLTAVPVTSADATVTFQWQSSTTGASWSNISGAKSSTYVVQEADETRLLRVVATAADLDGGGGIAKSAPTLAVKDADPTVTKPTIVGTTQEGQVLTASASAGQGDNPVTYQWLSSASGYKVAIGAGSTYKLKEADEGFTVEAVATAKNGDGLTVSQTCNATATVFDAAPTVSLPKISGTAQEGKTLTASATAGQADNPVTYQWFSSASAVAIGSGSTYKGAIAESW